MKIGFVIDDTLDKPDGVQQYVLTLGKWFSEQGYEVHYLAGQSTRSDILNVHSLSRNMNVRFNHNRLSIPLFSSKKQIRELLEQEQFDVLHVQMPYSPLMAGKIIRLAPAKTAIVGTFHIIPFSGLEKLGARLLGTWQFRNIRRVDTVVSVSRPAQAFAESAMGLTSTIIPNAVNVSAFQSGKKIAKYDDNKINIVFLGRLVERKGVQELLNAIQVLHIGNKLSNVRVLLCGKGPLDTKLKAYVKAHQLEGYVTFVGYINESDKANYLASAHIAVFPSLGGESFGIVLIEAMAAGSQTVLGGNNEGYTSVIGEQSTQLLDPKDSVEFANKLKFYIESSQARQSTQNWQKQHVKQYDVGTVGSQVLDVYKRAIAKRLT